MHQIVSDADRQRAAILADALRETVAELRLIEPGDIIGYIREAQWANIADLVQSSAELSFEEGVLSFGGTADFTMDWATPPSISLDMEFQFRSLSAFFTLVLARCESTIELQSVWYAVDPDCDAAGTMALETALREARRGRDTALPDAARSR